MSHFNVKNKAINLSSVAFKIFYWKTWKSLYVEILLLLIVRCFNGRNILVDNSKLLKQFSRYLSECSSARLEFSFVQSIYYYFHTANPI